MKRRQFLSKTSRSTLALATASPSILRAAEAGKAANHLVYPLRGGWIDHWLVAGPHSIAIPNAPYKSDQARRAEIVKKYFHAEPLVAAPFVEGAKFKADNDAPLEWSYYACKDDHLVDFTAWFGSARFVRCWAYVEINSLIPNEAAFQLYTNGPADVWVRGRHAHRTEAYDLVNPKRSEFKAKLEMGVNPVLVRFEHVAVLNTPFNLALRAGDVSFYSAIGSVSV